MSNVSLVKSDTTTPPSSSQTYVLLNILGDLLTASIGHTEPKVFSSGNTGVYIQRRLKAPEARALGIVVPTGGKVSFTLQALVIDPANSKDA